MIQMPANANEKITQFKHLLLGLMIKRIFWFYPKKKWTEDDFILSVDKTVVIFVILIMEKQT